MSERDLSTTPPDLMGEEAEPLNGKPLLPAPSVDNRLSRDVVNLAESLIGMPLLVAGLLAFALTVAGYVPVGAVIPVLAIVLVGEIIAARMTFRAGQPVLGALFAAVGGFWLTYGGVVIGLDHNWYNLDPADTSRALALFLGSWLALMLMLTVSSLVLALTYSLLLVLLDGGLALLLLGVITGTLGLFTAAAAIFFVAVALAAYLCMATTGPAAIRRALPMGQALLVSRYESTSEFIAE